MAREVLAGPLGELRAASTAGGGTALTTTATFILLPKNTKQVFLTPRNFATAVVAKFLRNPWLTVLKTTDNMLTLPLDYSNAAQDSDATTDVVLSSLDTAANGDFLLIGSHMPFRGVYCDVDGTNGSGTVATTINYWNSAWVDASCTDGTSSTRSFDQDGLISWTVPAAWRKEKLSVIFPNTPKAYYSDTQLYWVQLTVSAAVDSSCTLNSLVAANRSTAYAELVPGQAWEEKLATGFGGFGCIEALTDAGTANLVVNAATLSGEDFT